MEPRRIIAALSIRSATTGLMAFALTSLGNAQCQVDTLLGSGTPVGYLEGTQCFATSGTTIAVGHHPPFGPTASGGVYIFEQVGSTWVEEAHFTNPQLFGLTVALDGDRLVAGTASDPAFPVGAAFVYERTGTTWAEVATLLPPPGAMFADTFGSAVAVSGDTIVVSDVFPDPGETRPGRAYVFRGGGSSWTLEATLEASDAPPHPDYFGTCLALEGDRLFVSALQSYLSFGPGAVYEFERNGTLWTEVDKLVSVGGDPDERLGQSLAFDGTTLAVGAGNVIQGSPASGLGIVGLVYLFDESSGAWVQEAALSPPTAVLGDRFASSLDLSGDRLLVGAYTTDHVAKDNGAAYLFERQTGTWNESRRVYAADMQPADRFGVALGFLASGGFGVVSGNFFTGRVQLFEFDAGCPRATFAATPTSGPVPLHVAFQDQSTGAPAGWDWSFGDGAPGSTLASPMHTYSLPGTFDVALTVDNAVGADRAVAVDAIEALHAASATARNGSGLNPSCFASTSLPILGTTWTSEVDASGNAAPSLTFVAVFGTAHPGFASVFGEVLLDSSSPQYEFDLAPAVAGIGAHALSVPLDPALAGVTVAAQGAVAGSAIVLCNALDLVLGY